MSITITMKDYIVKRRKEERKKNMKDYSTWQKKKQIINLKDKINCEKPNKLPRIGGEPQYFSHVPEFIAFNPNNITLNE
jgi:hypothetical protein